jgi:hypothetical protein
MAAPYQPLDLNSYYARAHKIHMRTRDLGADVERGPRNLTATSEVTVDDSCFDVTASAGGWTVPQRLPCRSQTSPLGLSPDRDEIPGPASIRSRQQRLLAPPATPAGRTTRTPLSTVTESDTVAGHDLLNREKQPLELDVTGGARFARQEARRREPAVICQQPPVLRSPQFRNHRPSRPRGRRDYRNRWQRWHEQ